tara:strand:+ start:937 stop:1215 length:279 start_codon:yes stop_codon:yes gene_type:complete
MNDQLYNLLLGLDKEQRSDIKRCLSLDVSQAIRILKSGGKLTKLTKAKYGYYFNKFRIKIYKKQDQLTKSVIDSEQKDNYKEFLANSKLEQF